MKFPIIITILICFTTNFVSAEGMNSNSESTKEKPKTAYEHLMAITGPYKTSRKTIGNLVTGYGVIGLVAGTYGELQYHFNPNVDPEIQIGIIVCYSVGIPCTLWGISMLNKNRIAKQFSEMENLTLRENKARKLLLKIGKKAKIYRYIRGSLFGHYALGVIMDGRPITDSFVYIPLGLTLYTFLVKSKSEKEYNSYLKNRGTKTTTIIPMLRKDYFGIAVVKVF